MRASGRAVLTGAVVFAIAMGALESGGWWWAWLAGIVLLMFGGRVRLQLVGVRLSAANRFILRENRKTRRHTRAMARQRRRRIRDQQRAMRARHRQAQ